MSWLIAKLARDHLPLRFTPCPLLRPPRPGEPPSPQSTLDRFCVPRSKTSPPRPGPRLEIEVGPCGDRYRLTSPAEVQPPDLALAACFFDASGPYSDKI